MGRRGENRRTPVGGLGWITQEGGEDGWITREGGEEEATKQDSTQRWVEENRARLRALWTRTRRWGAIPTLRIARGYMCKELPRV